MDLSTTPLAAIIEIAKLSTAYFEMCCAEIIRRIDCEKINNYPDSAYQTTSLLNALGDVVYENSISANAEVTA